MGNAIGKTAPVTCVVCGKNVDLNNAESVVFLDSNLSSFVYHVGCFFSIDELGTADLDWKLNGEKP